MAGGLVTSNDAALSVPDWPLSWGKLIPPLEGNIRYEFTHRVLAATVAILTTILAIWLQSTERRAWLRRLGWAALAAVLAQALLGGAIVRFIDPHSLAIAHACLAQLCFGFTVAIALGQLAPAQTQVSARISLPLVAAAALFVQTVLGAALRHEVLTLVPHIVGAVAAAILVMWAALRVLMQHMEEAVLRRPAMLLLSLTASQIFLGVAAYMSRVATADDPQPMPMMIWFTTAHVVAGALAFGSAIALAMIVYWHEKPNRGEVAHGGMAVA